MKRHGLGDRHARTWWLAIDVQAAQGRNIEQLTNKALMLGGLSRKLPEPMSRPSKTKPGDPAKLVSGADLRLKL